jgi:hypothetical protein
MTVYSHPLKPAKTALIDMALEKYKIRSIVDLGGCWGVHGGYTFHALDHGKIKKAYIVDGHMTDPTKERAQNYPQLELISGALGDTEIAKKIGNVDAIIMYDIILHQVNPNWDKFLEIWGKQAKHLIIYNQDWTLDAEPVRFIDRGADWYIKNVPSGGEGPVKNWFAAHDTFNEATKGKLRDVHYFWQWGIPLKSLTKKLEKIGFHIDLAKADTPWSAQFPHIINDSILASKTR